MKLQNPSSKLQRNFKNQDPKISPRPFEVWRLVLLWSLDVGSWSFSNTTNGGEE
jgi:hypothetical protein